MKRIANNIKISVPLILSMAISFQAQAQYKINLTKVEYPVLTPLEMGNPGPEGKEIIVNNLYMTEGGKPVLPVMGELHYSRMHPDQWYDTLLKMKASGVNVVATYCLWSLHEEVEGEMSWENHLNLRKFVELCGEVGLKVHLRIGPYCNAEIRNGGLPDWLVANKNLKLRSNDPLYLSYIGRWYDSVASQVEGLMYKDGGPVYAIQIENEYVARGQIIPHLTKLKQMAIERKLEVPMYSMTHWMDSEYPHGEIVPFAGFYIEAPWTTSGKEEMPTSNFEFFTYNRLSDNIGTDIIKIEGEVESLSGENNDSPFFTCEVGLGTTTFYHRRAIVPREMAGEMINLRLGCGANLLGYYMYAGGTNPVGTLRTFESSGPRVNYDYQAPIREYGTLGEVMPETKKYNYFMNDFGEGLAPAVSYLPTSNQNHDNLQWAVRMKDGSGYIFCSNYLYRHDRKDYNNIQFTIKLDNETLKIPSKKITVKNGAYFHWPFNQTYNNVNVKYATVQPICRMKDGDTSTFFFFEDDGITGEFLITDDNIKEIKTNNSQCLKNGKNYVVKNLKAGKDCYFEVKRTDGSKTRFVVLSKEDSDYLWKGKTSGKEFVALTKAALIYNDDDITLLDNDTSTELLMYKEGEFHKTLYSTPAENLKATVEEVGPIGNGKWILPREGNEVRRTYALHNMSDIDKATFRYSSDNKFEVNFNGTAIEVQPLNGYYKADVTKSLKKGLNDIILTHDNANANPMAGEIEILLANGERILWQTDATWTDYTMKNPVETIDNKQSCKAFDPQEHLGIYKIFMPLQRENEDVIRAYLSYRGDVANAYLNGHLVADSYYDGSDWIIGLNHLKSLSQKNPLVVRIDGLKSADANIYFEKNVDPSKCVVPSLDKVDVKKENKYCLSQ